MIQIFPPLERILIYLLMVLIIFTLGVSVGLKSGQADLAKLRKEHAESVREFERQLSYEALMFELEREQLVKRARGKIRLVEKEIEKPVYRDCVLPDDGMRLHADTVKELNTPAQPRR